MERYGSTNPVAALARWRIGRAASGRSCSKSRPHETGPMKRDADPVSIRPAEPRDAETLANLHLACSRAQPGGFMHRLGRRFFVTYYRILLGERTTLVLVADAGADGLVGLVSATLDSRRQLEAIRKGRFRLLLAVIPELLRSPSLSWEIWVRSRSLSPKARGDGYVVSSGARIAYWGWLPGRPSHGRSLSLIKEVLRQLEGLGASKVSLETDHLNRKAELMLRLSGAQVARVMTTRDGRERAVLEYVLGPNARPGTT